MGENSKIEWTDHTFNPWVGCSKVSAACTHCYAETLANRFRPAERLWRGNRTRTKDWTKPLAWQRKATKDGTHPKVFPSMCDPFDDHPDLPPWREDFWSLIERTPNLVWLLLTKRPENVLRMVPSAWLEGWPRSVWVGTTVEDQERADERIPHLLRVPAPVRFLSLEPLLGPVDLGSIVCDPDGLIGRPTGARRYDALRGTLTESPSRVEGASIQWVITGGESGPRARPSHPDWFRALRDQCAAAGVPYFFKQWGEYVAAREAAGIPEVPRG